MKNRIKAYKKLNLDGEWEIYFKRNYKFGGTYDSRVTGCIDETEADMIIEALNSYKPEEIEDEQA